MKRAHRRKRLWRDGATGRRKVCGYCQKSFQPGHTKQRFCSRSCGARGGRHQLATPIAADTPALINGAATSTRGIKLVAKLIKHSIEGEIRGGKELSAFHTDVLVLCQEVMKL